MELQPPLSDQAQVILQIAENEAQALGQWDTGPIHILMAIASFPRTSGYFLLEQANVSPAALYSQLMAACRDPEMLPSANASAVIDRARTAAIQRGSHFVGVDDLLLSSLQCAGPAISGAFAQLGLSAHTTASLINRIWQEMVENGRIASKNAREREGLE
jgi:ATP-dependent Clp protease ATP-binding subunit ClpA